jgi:hypothetical protein
MIPRQFGEPFPMSDRAWYQSHPYAYRYGAALLPMVTDLDELLSLTVQATINQIRQGSGRYYGLGGEQRRPVIR